MTLRRIHYAFWLMALLGVVGMTQVFAAKKGDNLVQNNDFEDRGVLPWTLWV